MLTDGKTLYLGYDCFRSPETGLEDTVASVSADDRAASIGARMEVRKARWRHVAFRGSALTIEMDGPDDLLSLGPDAITMTLGEATGRDAAGKRKADGDRHDSAGDVPAPRPLRAGGRACTANRRLAQGKHLRAPDSSASFALRKPVHRGGGQTRNTCERGATVAAKSVTRDRDGSHWWSTM